MSKEKPKRDSHRLDDTGRWVLFATISASSMAFISGSALGVALPAIQRDLGASGGDLLWIVNAFALLLAALMLVGGSLGDHFGRKRIYMIGIVIFTIASVLSGFAPSPQFLIAARAIQGIGGALMVPGSLAIISAYFDSNTRGQAIGLWSSTTSLMAIAGPVLGGVLAENGLWRVIFFINVPLAVLALWALWSHVPESYDEEAAPELDYTGAVLVTAGMAGITFGAIGIGEVGQAGFTRPDLMGSLIGGIVLLFVFVFWERRSKHPMLSLRLFKSRTFTGANLLTLMLYGALGLALFFLPLNLVQVQGYGETITGFTLLPMMGLLIVMSPRMGGFVDKYGPRLPLIIGPLVVAAAFVALAIPGVTKGPATYWWTYFPGTVLLGLGMGMVVAPLTTSVMGAVPQHYAGVASGVNNAMSRSSQVLATSIMGGIALLVFTGALLNNVEPLSLSQEIQQELAAASQDLGNTTVPQSLDESTAAEVESAIDKAFVAMFRVMALTAAGMSVLSAVFGAILIEKELVPLDDELPGLAGEDL